LQRSNELRLESFEDNETANTFYRKNGWRELSRYFDNESGVNKIVFQKIVRVPSPEDSRDQCSPNSCAGQRTGLLV
jgi:hypothetical protein